MVSAVLVLLAGCLDDGTPVLTVAPDDPTDALEPDASGDAGTDETPALPPASWVRRVGNAGARDYANAAVELPGGIVVLAGFVEDESDRRTWVAGFGPDGSLRWGGRLPSTVTWVSAAAPAPEGSVLLAGSGASGTGGQLVWVEADGAIRTARSLSAAGSARIYALASSPRGGWFVAGSRSAGGTAGDRAWVALLEADGTAVWSVWFPDLEFAQRGSVAATPDGGAVLAAESIVGGRVQLLRLGPDGSVRWQRGVAAGSLMGPYPSAAVAADGDLVAAYPDDGDIVVVRFAEDGSLRWRARVGGTAYERGGPLVGTPDGGLLVGGTRDSGGETTYDTWLALLDASGGLAWERTIRSDRLEETHDLRLTGDGAVLLTAGGCCTSIVARLTLDGTSAGRCDVLQTTDAVSEVGTTLVTAESPDVESFEVTVRDDFLTLEPDRWVTEVLCE